MISILYQLPTTTTNGNGNGGGGGGGGGLSFVVADEIRRDETRQNLVLVVVHPNLGGAERESTRSKFELVATRPRYQSRIKQQHPTLTTAHKQTNATLDRSTNQSPTLTTVRWTVL
jgi:hypothetical protein